MIESDILGGIFEFFNERIIEREGRLGCAYVRLHNDCVVFFGDGDLDFSIYVVGYLASVEVNWKKREMNQDGVWLLVGGDFSVDLQYPGSLQLLFDYCIRAAVSEMNCGGYYE